MEDIEEEIPMTAHYLRQLEENNVMADGKTFMPINPEDDDEQHLVAM